MTTIPTVTREELFSAANAAGLPMPDAVTDGDSSLLWMRLRETGPYRVPASLADVECAVMDGLPVGINVYKAHSHDGGWMLARPATVADERDARFCGTNYQRHPTRADALYAACIALAASKKVA
jgi:hypothetical protein